jgi:hypothetical protein
MSRTKPVEVEIGGLRCKVFRGRWSAPYGPAREALQAADDRLRGRRPPSADPDWAAAQEVAGLFRGRVLSPAAPSALPRGTIS